MSIYCKRRTEIYLLCYFLSGMGLIFWLVSYGYNIHELFKILPHPIPAILLLFGISTIPTTIVLLYRNDRKYKEITKHGN